MNDITIVTVAEGKYTFRYEPGKTLACDRYGEAWIDEFNMGSNALVQLIHLADDQAQCIAELEGQVEDPNGVINDLSEDYAEAKQRIAELERSDEMLEAGRNKVLVRVAELEAANLQLSDKYNKLLVRLDSSKAVQGE